MQRDKNAETFDIWADNNPIMEKAYEHGNIRIRKVNPASKLCILYFSGNGLYFPNDRETFEAVIGQKDRYEWERVSQSSHLKKRVGKEIFVRDIYKQWYVQGINKTLDSADKLAEYLKKETEGYRVVTAGNSAGGYAAVLFGLLLKADVVFDFSGQFEIESLVDTEGFFLKKYRQCPSKTRYYNLVPMLKKSRVPVMYFYPCRCGNDIRQHSLVENIDNVYSFPFDLEEHGATMYGVNYPYIFTKSAEELKTLHGTLQGKPISQKKFLFQSAGKILGTWCLLRKSAEGIVRRAGSVAGWRII